MKTTSPILLTLLTRVALTMATLRVPRELGQDLGSNALVGEDHGADFLVEERGELGGKVPSVSFCCERNYYFDMVNRTCEDSGRKLGISFHTMESTSVPERDVSFVGSSGFISCPSHTLPASKFKIITDGLLIIHEPGELDFGQNPPTFLGTDQYCLLWLDQEETLTLTALICFPEDNVQDAPFHRIARSYVVPSIMAVSALFLGATFFVYCVVRELRDLLGKSLMCCVACLFLSKLFVAVLTFAAGSLSIGVVCVFMAIIVHLSFLQAAFWLNVISCILFMSCFQGKLNRYSNKKCFGFGSLYAFGVPLIIAGLVLIHDFTSAFDNSSVPKPEFGVASCAFSNRGAQAIYFYTPISLLLGVNFLLFCASACRIFILAKRTSVFVFQFTHYLKLFILMGIPWTFEVFSFFFGQNNRILASSYVWLAFDIFNAFQGVIIFFVFACRRTVLARLAETLCGSSYAKKKYPDVFLQHANDEAIDTATQSLRMTVADKENEEDLN